MNGDVKPGYKQTEVGVIPEDWKLRPLLTVVRVASGQVDPKAEPYKFMTLVAPDHIESGTGRLIGIQTAAEQRAISGKYLFEKGDIVYSKIRPYLRKAILAGFSGLCSADMYPLKSAQDVCSSFIFSVLLGEHFSKYAETVSVRSGMPKINRGEMAEYVVALPPLPEQEAIAEALSDADALIESLTQLIAKKRQLKQGAMQELLTGKRRLHGFANATSGYKQTEVGVIPEDWELKTLGKVCVFENGDRGINYPSPKSFVHSGIPFVNAGHIAEGHINRNDLDFITQESYNRLGSGKFKSGDILFCLRGSLGKFGVIAPDFGEGAIASSLVIVRHKSQELYGNFLICYLNSHLCTQMIEKWSGGAAQPNLGVQDLAKFLIPLPNKAEQEAIAEVLSEMDAEITVLETKLAKARQLKQGMMHNLLTGRIRLV